MFRPVFAALLGCVLCASAWAEGSVSTVNGSIHVGSPPPSPPNAAEADQHSVNKSFDIDGTHPVGSLSTVNGSINIDAAQHTGDLTVVNGGIHVGANSSIGHVTTVNGGVTLGQNTTANSLGTVNGGIHVGPGSHVNGSIHSVNGTLDLQQSTDVSGPVSSVNGKIQLGQAAHVGGDLDTVTGDIDAGANSHVDGNLHVEKRHASWFDWIFGIGDHRVPRIVIGPGAVVKGKLIFEQEVKLYVSDRATVGPIEGATPVKFSGDKAPD
jgi:DUF4097 and DUF4098 domain-containing protein YvlB